MIKKIIRYILYLMSPDREIDKNRYNAVKERYKKRDKK